MIKKIILGVVFVIAILSSVVLANSSMQGYSRTNNVNCIYNENCIKENCTNNICINQNCDDIGTQQRNKNCSSQNKNCRQSRYKRMCH